MFRLARTITVFGISAVLAGCTMVPTSGSVTKGVATLKQDTETVHFDPAHPAKGASQEDIVRGFINAASSAAGDYQVAREFLTPGYASQWKPTETVYIDDSQRGFQNIDNNVITVSINAIATVNQIGVLTNNPAKTPTDLRFELEQIDGEWRIKTAPAGLLLSKNLFSTVWEKHTLYFPSPNGTMIADPRWFVARSAMPAQIMAQLIAGPSKHISAAVGVTFPTGTSLVGNGVTVKQDTANVDLSAATESLTQDNLRLISEQVTKTMSTVRGVNSVNLTINGTPVAKPAAETLTGASDFRPTVVLKGNHFEGVKNDTKITEFPGADAVIGMRPSSVSAQVKGSIYACLTDSGVYLVNLYGKKQLSDNPDSTQPTVDKFGNVWFARRTGSGAVEVHINGTKTVPFNLNIGGEQQIIAVKPSPDGARVAVLLQGVSGAEVRVFAVTRDSSGAVTAIDVGSQVPQVFQGAPLSLDWVTSYNFAILTFEKDSGHIMLGDVGDFPEDRGNVANAKSLAGTSDHGGIRVLNRNGELFATRGTSGWQLVDNKISLLLTWG